MPLSDLELLSAHLDGQLSPKDEAALQERLAVEADLRQQLDDLRRTVQILRAAPPLAVPRNFTLDPVRFRRAAPWWARYGVLRMAGALGAAASVLLIVFGVIWSASLNGAGGPAEGVAMRVTSAPTSAPGPQFVQPSAPGTPTPANSIEFQGAGGGTDALNATQDVVDAIPITPTPPSPPSALLSARTATPSGPAESQMGALLAATATQAADLAGNGAQEAAATATPALTMAAMSAATSQRGQDKAQATPTQTRTRTPLPTATTTPPPTSTPAPTMVAVQPTIERRLVPTVGPTPVPVADGQSLAPGARLALVAGLMLLLVSAVVLLIGWLRSRV